MEKEDIKRNISSGEQWTKLIYIFLFGIVLYLVMMVLFVVVMVQVVFALFTGSTNENIQEFSQDLARYINQIVLFLTYNESRKPYPFNPLNNQREEENTVDEHEIVTDVGEVKADADDSEKPAT